MPNPPGGDDLGADQIAIMPIGDSRVEGFRPEHESYRFHFWRLMENENFNFNLIGAFEDSGSYPMVNGKTFDNDHSGVGGDQTFNVLDRLDNYLAIENRAPDVVLLGIGGNDLLTPGSTIDGIVTNIGTIIDRIQSANPNVIILLELIAGMNPNIDIADEVNAQVDVFSPLVIQLAADKTTSNSIVSTVDMFSNFTSDPTNFADDIHYSEKGAEEIGKRYFDALRPLIE